MNNQIDIFSMKEEPFENILFEEIKSFLDKNNFLYDTFLIKKNINDFSFMLSNSIFIKAMKKNNINSLILRKSSRLFLENNNILYKEIKNSPWIVANYEEFKEKNLLFDLFLDIYKSMPAEYDFSCCSRYMECSNQKHCIHDDKSIALKCSYRKKLENGIIFYGENRNV